MKPKLSRKNKLVLEIIEELTNQNKEITHAAVSNWVMGRVNAGDHSAGRYGGLRQSDIADYFLNVHDTQ